MSSAKFSRLVEQLVAEYEKLADENRRLKAADDSLTVSQWAEMDDRSPGRSTRLSGFALRSPNRGSIMSKVRSSRHSFQSDFSAPVADIRKTFMLTSPALSRTPGRTQCGRGHAEPPSSLELHVRGSPMTASESQARLSSLADTDEDQRASGSSAGDEVASAPSKKVQIAEPDRSSETEAAVSQSKSKPMANMSVISLPVVTSDMDLDMDMTDGTLADDLSIARHVPMKRHQIEIEQTNGPSRSYRWHSTATAIEKQMTRRNRFNLTLSLSSRRDLGQSESACVINPESSLFLQRWDVVTMIALCFVAICVPVHVAMVETRIDVFFIFSTVVDAIFFTDMILQFFLMYTRRTSFGYVLEHNHMQIVKHYLKGWFVIDFLSILPVDVVGLATQNSELRQMKAVKVIRLLRLLKLARLARAARLARRFEARASIPYGKLAILKFFGILLLITHWLANLWALGLMLVEADEGIPRWIDEITDREAKAQIQQKTVDTGWKLYITCLYFTSYTITSVGYGDIGPKNIVEVIVATIMIIVAGISWAVVLGQVCGIVTNLSTEEQEFRSRMDELNNMMEDRVMEPNMRRRLRTFFLSSRTARRRERQRQIIGDMSPGLQGEVVMEINKVWISKVSMLSQLLKRAGDSEQGAFYRAFVVEVSLKLKSVTHAQSEVFGQPHVLYILILGLVARRHRIHKSGAVWGLDFMLVDSRLVEPFESFALTYVELTTLKRRTFMDLVARHGSVHPEIRQKIRYFCCWLSFQRTFMREAKKKQARLAGSPDEVPLSPGRVSDSQSVVGSLRSTEEMEHARVVDMNDAGSTFSDIRGV